jgi:hypothetical protein
VLWQQCPWARPYLNVAAITDGDVHRAALINVVVAHGLGALVRMHVAKKLHDLMGNSGSADIVRKFHWPAAAVTTTICGFVRKRAMQQT